MAFDAKALDARLQRLMEYGKFPGVSVCIRGPEGIIFEKGYGMRSVEQNLPMTPQTVCGIASMSKSLTALACAILETEGKLSMSDPVYKYFPKFDIKGTPRDSVTLYHLATHTAGIPPMEPLEWSIVCNTSERESEENDLLRKNSPNKMDNIDQIVDYIANCGYQALGAPGEYMSYSNEGYALLSYVVDMTAGMTLEEFLDKRVFAPLGMKRSVLDQDGSRAKVLAQGNITRLFEHDEKGKLFEDDNWSVLPPFRGCACVKSTAEDITRYYQCLSNKGVFEGKQVFPAAAVDAMVGASFPETIRPYYCYGLNKRTKAGHVFCDHAGGLHGVSTFGGFIKDENYSCAALCNEGGQDVDDMVWAMYNAIIGLPVDVSHRWSIPVGRDFSQPEMLVGSYLGHEGLPTTVEIYTKDGKLFAKNKDGDAYGVYCGGTVFNFFKEEKPDELFIRMEFFVRDGVCWAVKCGTRIFQRV